MRQKQAFKVKTGIHYHREPGQEKTVPFGKGQEAGDTIVTTQDLIGRFPEKFELMHEARIPQAAEATVAAVPPAQPAAAPQDSLRVGGEQEEAPNGTHPVDATKDFPKAKKLGFVVFERAGKYYVADKDNPEKFANKKGLAKAEVEAFAIDQA
jgi:hypothetical protein